jgi:hypothetical protein
MDKRQESLDNLAETSKVCTKVLKDFYAEHGLEFKEAPKEEPKKYVWNQSIRDELRKVGQEAIEESKDIIKRFGWNLCQLDWIIDKSDKWCSIEVKHLTPLKDAFKISRRQVRDRLRLQSARNIKAILLIKNRVNGVWYWQYLDALEQGNHWNDEDKPRSFVHYPLDSFQYMEI